MTSAALTVTNAQGAVIATSPASTPLTDMLRSGLPSHVQFSAVAESIPMNAAVLVVMKMCAIALASTAIVDPGIEPEPAEPQHEAADHARREAVRRNRVHLPVRSIFAEPRAENQDAGQRGPAAHAVHDRRTREIPEPGRRQKSSAPDPVAGDG